MEMWVFATITLVVGMVDDLRSRKVRNSLVLFLLPACIAASLYYRGPEGSLLGTGAFIASLVMTIPLFMARIFGGGDVKLFAVFSFCVDPLSMFWTLVYSLVWGALFGVSRAALQNQLMSLVRTTYRVASRQRVEPQEIHKIPYTFSLLLGWFTQLTLMRAGGLL